MQLVVKDKGLLAKVRKSEILVAVTRDEIPRLTQDHATSLRAELNKGGIEPNPGPGLSYRHLTALKVNGQETESDESEDEDLLRYLRG